MCRAYLLSFRTVKPCNVQWRLDLTRHVHPEYGQWAHCLLRTFGRALQYPFEAAPTTVRVIHFQLRRKCSTTFSSATFSPRLHSFCHRRPPLPFALFPFLCTVSPIPACSSSIHA